MGALGVRGHRLGRWFTAVGLRSHVFSSLETPVRVHGQQAAAPTLRRIPPREKAAAPQIPAEPVEAKPEAVLAKVESAPAAAAEEEPELPAHDEEELPELPPHES